VDRYSFTVWNFHPLPPAGFDRRTNSSATKINFSAAELACLARSKRSFFLMLTQARISSPVILISGSLKEKK
jgi:hypothetical protein